MQCCSNVRHLSYRGWRPNLIGVHFGELRVLDLRDCHISTDFSAGPMRPFGRFGRQRHRLGFLAQVSFDVLSNVLLPSVACLICHLFFVVINIVVMNSLFGLVRSRILWICLTCAFVHFDVRFGSVFESTL